MKQYTKQSVTKGEWYTRAEGITEDGQGIKIKVQVIDGEYQDHYAIYVNGKRERKTYFGETAHYDVAREYNDRVGWQQFVDGMSL